jgi:hypothetical protein
MVERPLEADIQDVWGKASATLPCPAPNPREVTSLVVNLRDCARRANAIGFLTGEKELLRMAEFLIGRITKGDCPQYATNASDEPTAPYSPPASAPASASAAY